MVRVRLSADIKHIGSAHQRTTLQRVTSTCVPHRALEANGDVLGYYRLLRTHALRRSVARARKAATNSCDSHCVHAERLTIDARAQSSHLYFGSLMPRGECVPIGRITKEPLGGVRSASRASHPYRRKLATPPDTFMVLLGPARLVSRNVTPARCNLEKLGSVSTYVGFPLGEAHPRASAS